MNIVILTANETLYLPAFFTRLFKERDDIRAVFCTPPGHGKKNSRLNMAKKYRRAFGTVNLFKLAFRMVKAKLCDKLGMSNQQRGYSVPSVAKAFNVECDFVEKVNDPAFLDRLRALNTDLIISVSCPQIFKRPLIDLAPRGCLNIHGAPLPNYRGLLPSFWMMANGETKAAVTVFLVNEDIDAGDVVVMDHFDILPDESLHEFIIRSKQLHCDALLKAIERVEAGTPETVALETEGGSYFSFPTRDAYRQFKSKGRRLW